MKIRIEEKSRNRSYLNSLVDKVLIVHKEQFVVTYKAYNHPVHTKLMQPKILFSKVKGCIGSKAWHTEILRGRMLPKMKILRIKKERPDTTQDTGTFKYLLGPKPSTKYLMHIVFNID